MYILIVIVLCGKCWTHHSCLMSATATKVLILINWLIDWYWSIDHWQL